MKWVNRQQNTKDPSCDLFEVTLNLFDLCRLSMWRFRNLLELPPNSWELKRNPGEVSNGDMKMEFLIQVAWHGYRCWFLHERCTSITCEASAYSPHSFWSIEHFSGFQLGNGHSECQLKLYWKSLDFFVSSHHEFTTAQG